MRNRAIEKWTQTDMDTYIDKDGHNGWAAMVCLGERSCIARKRKREREREREGEARERDEGGQYEVRLATASPMQAPP